ncbi:MAG TPA: hypothetical protein VFE96_08675 [Candidatus Bathyarchaeia archaeon]|nr:hypothetical protein [Candidatus Bathyarchaeia archaeon]
MTIVLTLVAVLAFAPLFITGAHAYQGCQPGTPPTCYLYAQTNVPSSDGTVMVRQDNNNALVYSLPHLFAFPNSTYHSIEVLMLTITGTPSGARYLWDSKAQWTWHGIQWTPSANMSTPQMDYNYTAPNDQFTAYFDKQFQYTLNFKDMAGNPLSPPPTTVTLSGPGSTITATSYTSQWLSAGSWTVTSASWEGYQTALSASVPLDLSSSSKTVTATILAYPATLKVVDNLSHPISGASVTITFANITSRAFTTNTQGTISLGDIPFGPYSAQVSYQGQTQGPFGEDASASSTSTITLNIGGSSSAPVVSGLVLLTIFGVALFLILLAIKVRKPPPPPQI